MAGQRTGSLVAASFGVVYVMVNSGGLSDSVASSLRALAVVVFAAVVAAATLGCSRATTAFSTSGAQPTVYGRVFWGVVAAEAAALWGGLLVLNRFFDLPEAGVAWVSIVVGVHFFALAVVFDQAFFHVLGVAITACGAVALLLAVTGWGVAQAPAVVGGVVPGAVLLSAGWWGVRRSPTEDDSSGGSRNRAGMSS